MAAHVLDWHPEGGRFELRLRVLLMLWVALALMIVGAPATAGGDTVASQRGLPYPASMAALGDSLTLASQSTAPGDQPANSWSTGTTRSVQSHYLRILAANPAIKGKAYNLAVGSAGFPEMQAQARKAVARHVQYVTAWGGEDEGWCGASDLKGLTTEVEKVLGVLAGEKPQPWVFLASIRNPATIFREVRAHRAAALHNFPTGITIECGLVVGAKPAQDSSPTAVAKAAASAAQINATIARACAKYPRCRFDGNAVYRMPLRFSDLADDYGHMSLAGERHVAEVTWHATFPFGR